MTTTTYYVSIGFDDGTAIMEVVTGEGATEEARREDAESMAFHIGESYGNPVEVDFIDTIHTQED